MPKSMGGEKVNLEDAKKKFEREWVALKILKEDKIGW